MNLNTLQGVNMNHGEQVHSPVGGRGRSVRSGGVLGGGELFPDQGWGGVQEGVRVNTFNVLFRMCCTYSQPSGEAPLHVPANHCPTTHIPPPPPPPLPPQAPTQAACVRPACQEQ
jgi:hypothetical protein